jgi:hypothetical protein
VARLKFSPVTDAAVKHIAKNLRINDVQELRAVLGNDMDAYECLIKSVAVSEECHVLTTHLGEPVALFGLAPVYLLNGQGCPWLLATDGLMDHPRDIVMLGKRKVLEWGKRYDKLFNFVDARNLRSIAWLKHIGFTVLDPEPFGVEGLPFHRFERCA